MPFMCMCTQSASTSCFGSGSYSSFIFSVEQNQQPSQVDAEVEVVEVERVEEYNEDVVQDEDDDSEVEG